MKTPHKLDRTRQAAPQVFEWLRGSILSLQLAPGTALSRAELADRFELSQTPVRDALLQLAQAGLVDIFPQHATLVSRIDIPSATQAHFLRCAIELEVVRTLALAPADDTAVLRAKLTAQIDLQAALAIADLGGQFAGRLKFVEQAAGAGVKRLAGRCEPRLSRGALEQRRLQLAFQFFDLPAQGRLGDEQALGGGAEIQLLSYGNKALQLVNRHRTARLLV